MFAESSAKTVEKVDAAFLKTAKTIYQNIQDGSWDLQTAQTGVQINCFHSLVQRTTLNPEQEDKQIKYNCSTC